MKLVLYADPHFSQSSSILVGKSNSLAGRLDSLVKSFDWIRRVLISEVAFEHPICLGDFSDKPALTSEELTAIDACCVSDHWSLVGNHCRSDKEGKINSVSALVAKSFSDPEVLEIGGRRILFLPYNSEPYDLGQFGKVDVILSHNDLEGYDLGGGHLSTSGYKISDILNHCELFINGHLHNGGWIIKDRIVNLGTMCGMNFSSCGGEWEPSIGILDLDNLHLEIRENPYALRFKKVEFNNLSKLKGYLDNLPNLTTYVLQAKVPLDISKEARQLIDQCPKVVASRVLVKQDESQKVEVSQISKTTTEHKSIYDKFRDYLKTQSVKLSVDKIGKLLDELESLGEGVE